MNRVSYRGMSAMVGFSGLVFLGASVLVVACKDDANEIGSDSPTSSATTGYGAGVTTSNGAGGTSGSGGGHTGTSVGAGSGGSASHGSGGASSSVTSGHGGASSSSSVTSGHGGASSSSSVTSGHGGASSSSSVTSGHGGAGGGSVTTGHGGAGGSTSSVGSGGGGPCAGSTCSASEVCVAYRISGGAVIPPDASGHCPAGSHVEGGYCQPDFSYKCTPLYGSCGVGGTIDCACAQQMVLDNPGTCPTGYPSCSDPSPTMLGVDPAAQLICQELAP